MPPVLSVPRLSLVVAACNNMGIGIEERLPWRLKGDVAFFRKLTLKREDTSKCNAVIMGRKTWDSIPANFRPLADRINVVISRNLPLDSVLSESGDVQIAHGLDEAVELLNNEKRAEQQKPLVENIFIIGGSSIYQMALNSPLFHRLYLTRIDKDFTCDTFLPSIDYSTLQEIHLPDIPSEQLEDNGIPYKFHVYEKIQSNGNCNGSNNGVSQTSAVSNGHSIPAVTAGALPVYISAAVEEKFGFGKNGKLPWSLGTEYEHFISLVTETTDPDKKVVFIKGRVTWEDTSTQEKEHPKVLNIIVSKTMHENCGDACPASVHKVVDTFKSAIQEAQSLHLKGFIETAWIMGGENIFRDAINSGHCNKIYLTHVESSYDCDVFFPAFKHCFKEIIEKRRYEESEDKGKRVNMIYKVYERISEPSYSSHQVPVVKNEGTGVNTTSSACKRISEQPQSRRQASLVI